MPLLQDDIEAGLKLCPPPLTSDAARVLLYATSREENPARSPRQIIKNPKTGELTPTGPAAGDYQFEQGGPVSKAGVWGVLNHYKVGPWAAYACKARGVDPTPAAVFAAIQHDPVLAAALARLLYYSSPKALPKVGDEAGAWAIYLNTWRPGAYARQPEELRAKWRKSYADAMKAYGFA